jgi:hypothetical protein
MNVRLRSLLSAFVLSLAPLQATAAVHAHAQTPEDAAIGTVYAAPGKRITVVRENRAGRYAMILLSNAMMESSPMNSPILVERFFVRLASAGCRKFSLPYRRARA